MPLQRLQTLPFRTRHIPHLHRIVPRPRRNLRPIWKTTHWSHLLSVCSSLCLPSFTVLSKDPEATFVHLRKRHTFHNKQTNTIPPRQIPQLPRPPSWRKDTLFRSPDNVPTDSLFKACCTLPSSKSKFLSLPSPVSSYINTILSSLKSSWKNDNLALFCSENETKITL